MRHISLILVSALALSACKEPKESYTITTENGQQATVEVERGSNTVTIATPEGNAKLTMGTENANLPAYAPHYPGSEYGMAIAGQGKDGKGQMVSLSTTDPADKVVEFYKAKMTAAGMTPEVKIQGSNGFASIAAKGADNQGAMVTVIPGSDGKTIISIISGDQGG